MAKIKFSNAEIRKHLIFKWKKKIYYGICKLSKTKLMCEPCKSKSVCTKWRNQKMFSG